MDLWIFLSVQCFHLYHSVLQIQAAWIPSDSQFSFVSLHSLPVFTCILPPCWNLELSQQSNLEKSETSISLISTSQELLQFIIRIIIFHCLYMVSWQPLFHIFSCFFFFCHNCLKRISISSLCYTMLVESKHLSPLVSLCNDYWIKCLFYWPFFFSLKVNIKAMYLFLYIVFIKS